MKRDLITNFTINLNYKTNIEDEKMYRKISYFDCCNLLIAISNDLASTHNNLIKTKFFIISYFSK